MNCQHLEHSAFIEGRRTRGLHTIGVFAPLLLVAAFTCRSATAQTPASKNEATATRQFELQIVDPDKKPVPRASVEIRGGLAPTARPVLQGEIVSIGASRTLLNAADEGRVVLEIAGKPARFVVKIQHPGYGPYWAQWDSQDHPESVPPKLVAELEAGWTVGGVVVDKNGMPIEGAKVNPHIKFKKRPGDHQDLYTGEYFSTDADGKWSYQHVPASMREVLVSIDHPDYKPERPILSRSEYEIASNAEPTGKIVLSRGIMVTGTLTDEAGKPIENAVIRTKFLNDPRTTTTAEDGTYFLAGCEPRMVRIVIHAKGMAMDMKQVQVEPGMSPLDFTMKPGGRIRVRVVDEQDKPLPRSRIFFQEWRGDIRYFEFDHVNDYTDHNGVWEWNEAPHDEFKADICPPNGMQLVEQPLVAREEEYVFRRVPLLVISGKVVDSEIKEPIERFRVIPGIRSSESQMNWSQYESFDAIDGQYHVKRNRGYFAHMVRIEANGYQSATSRDIKSNEGKVTLDFELNKADNIEAKVITPEGEPAAGAKIAVGVAGAQIWAKNGDIDDGSTYAARQEADEGGQISIPPQDGPFHLLIVHPAGFAHLKSAEAPIPETVKLTPWARVEGVFRVGPKPASGVQLEINSEAIHSYGEGSPSIFTGHETTTAVDGSFLFERVFPGKARLGRRLVYMVGQGALETTSSKTVPFELKAGETKRIVVGGDGRAVTGRLAPPAGHNEKVMWHFASIQVQVDLGEPKHPKPPADVENDPTKYAAWWKQWSETDEGKAWREAYQAIEKKRATTAYYQASVGRDGTFRIDDMPPGDYRMNIYFHEQPAGRLSNHGFTVPPGEAGDEEKPADLDTITLEKSN